jgi:uncharacterized protein YkwD
MVLRRLIALALLGSLLTAAPSAHAATRCAGADSKPSATPLSTVERATLCLLNDERSRRGLPALDSNRRLHSAAVAHSRDMARRDYFAHNTLGGSDWGTRIRRYGYSGGLIGENIAWGAGSLSTPRSIVRAWMRSSGHRANILRRRFDEVGIGIARGAPVPRVRDAAVYTADFGGGS